MNFARLWKEQEEYADRYEEAMKGNSPKPQEEE